MATTGKVTIFEHPDAGRSFAAGETFFEAGQMADVMYVVLDGEVDLVVEGSVRETVGPGGIFGEMALVDEAPRSATAVGREAGRVEPLDRRQFEFLIHEHPFFAVQVMSIMAARLRRSRG